jgi:hypothetical protein
MSLTGSAPGVTTGDLLNLQAGIQGFTDTAQAAAEAALIQAGKDTTDAYATRLEIANTATSEVVMATVSLMQNPPGGVPLAGKLVTPTSPTANEFQHLIISYLPAQQAFAVANKLNVTVYNAEVVALGTGAGGDGTQNNFLKNWGSAALTLTQFETSLSQLTNVGVMQIDAQYQFFVKLYGAAPVNLPGGYANADAAARAVTFGFAVGTDMDNPTLNPALIAEVENAKVLNALTINGDVAGASGYQTNKALFLQPIAPPLQGAAGPPTSLVLTIGVDTPTQGFTTGKGATATVAGSTFVATPGGNPPLGVANTLNAGDDLEATGAAAGNAVLQYTAIESLLGINPAFAQDVTMNGVGAANIVNNTIDDLAGFSGNITGLTKVTASGNGNAGTAVQVGAPTQGLNTALQQLTINNGGLPFTAWFTAAALAASPLAISITLNNDGDADPPVPLNLEVTTGAKGYTEADIASTGGNNSVELDTGTITSLATIKVTGDQDLALHGTLLNIGNLHTLDASALKADLHVEFSGTGNVAAKGGSGDDTFTFTTPGSFTPASSVDGGGGADNELVLVTAGGDLLLPGVGPNIVNINRVQADGDGVGSTVTVDMSRSGSANILELDGSFGNHDVSVSNLTNAKSVDYTASNVSDLILAHTAGGFANVVNLTMDGGVTLNQLTVAAAPGLVAVNIDSTGGNNVITDVSTVRVNVAITGDTHLTFGSQGGPYSFVGGIIDATTDTGGVQTWLANLGGPTSPAQTFRGGPGNDTVHVLNFGHDLIDISTGGNDIVDFHATFPNGGGGLNQPNNALNYNSVVGFTANDTINITNTAATDNIAFTNDGVVPTGVAGGVASSILLYTTGSLVNAAGLADNWIKVVTPISGAGDTATTGFFSAMGAGGTIDVSAAHFYLMSFYDLTDQLAAFVTVNSAAGGSPVQITQADATNAGVHVVGLIHMSQADYAALTTANLHFV